jgi:hypothetical protein
MAMVAGFDLRRSQITYDALNVATGEIVTGRIMPADRVTLRRFLQRWIGEEVQVAVEATTGWRFVVEELQRADAHVQLAEPADTTAARGPKRRAKTDRHDARHVRDLLVQQRVPQAWIAPEHILELRALVRLRKTLVEQRTEWLQRIHAVLFHHAHGSQSRAWMVVTRMSSSRRLTFRRRRGSAGLRRSEASALVLGDVDELRRDADPRLRHAIKSSTSWWLTVRYAKGRPHARGAAR